VHALRQANGRANSLFGLLVADGWCWFVVREEYCWLVAGGWFVLREKYCWLVADKPSEQGATFRRADPSGETSRAALLQGTGTKFALHVRTNVRALV
jgi:hypothetical protein